MAYDWKVPGSGSTWGRKPTHKRGPVTWTDDSGTTPAHFLKQYPTYVETIEPSGDLASCLYVGSLWLSTLPFILDAKGSGRFPRLLPLHGKRCVPTVAAQSTMIYTGPERLDEQKKKNGRIVSVVRHTFLIAGTRYVIADLSSLVPLA